MSVPPSVPTVPVAGESFRGFIIRACQRNGWPGMIRFLRSIDLKAPDLRPPYDTGKLAIALGIPAEAFDCLPKWGQEGNDRIWPIGRARSQQRYICPQCLVEHRIQPNWCDLDFITACPVHDIDLVGHCGCGTPLTFRDRSLDHCNRCAANVCHLPAAPKAASAKPFERYALGRLGILPEVSLAVLDNLPLALALDLVHQLAGLAHAGYSTAHIDYSDLKERSEANEQAFEALATDTLAPLFGKVVLGFRNSTGILSPKTPIKALGAFAHFVERLTPYPDLVERIRQALETALGFPIPKMDECDYVHIDTVAHEAGTSAASIVRMLMAAGHMRHCHPHDDDLFIPIDIAWSLIAGHSRA